MVSKMNVIDISTRRSQQQQRQQDIDLRRAAGMCRAAADLVGPDIARSLFLAAARRF